MPRVKKLECKVDFVDVVGQEAAKRALLVAISGGHSILLVGPPGYGKSMLRNAALELSPSLRVEEARPCPCGYYNDPRSSCICDAKEVGLHRARYPTTDILIEVSSVSWRELESDIRGTSSDDIGRQIKAAGDRPVKIDGDAITLLKAAYTDMGLSPRDVNFIRQVAITIAALDNGRSVGAQHIVEAINYQVLR